MNTYTFTLPKNTTEANTWKNKLINRIVTAYPWLTIESKVDYPYSNYGIENIQPGDMFTLGVSRTHDIGWIPNKCVGCPFTKNCMNNSSSYTNMYNNVNYNLSTEFEYAMEALSNYAYKNKYFEKGYDFKDIFGQPVKIFNDFVQVGYNIIPRNDVMFFNTLKPETKKTIIDIVITVKNNNMF